MKAADAKRICAGCLYKKIENRIENISEGSSYQLQSEMFFYA